MTTALERQTQACATCKHWQTTSTDELDPTIHYCEALSENGDVVQHDSPMGIWTKALFSCIYWERGKREETK